MSHVNRDARKKFSPHQSAAGIVTTYLRGDATLAIARIRQVPEADREHVIALVTSALSKPDVENLRRYGQDLFA